MANRRGCRKKELQGEDCFAWSQHGGGGKRSYSMIYAPISIESALREIVDEPGLSKLEDGLISPQKRPQQGLSE